MNKPSQKIINKWKRLNKKSYRIISFDCETKLIRRQHVVTHLGCCESSWKFAIFEGKDCAEEFIDWVVSPFAVTYYFIAHNFSSFDSFFIIPILIKKKFKIKKLFVRNNNIIFLLAEFDGIVFNFRDTFLHVGLPLSEIFEMFGWKKKFLEIYSRNDLITYLAFDVIGLMRLCFFITKMTTRMYSLNIFGCISVAQFSYKNFCGNFMEKTVYYLNNKLREFLQPHFRGNKILITKNIGQKLFFYDVNSMYPYMMLRNLPNEYIGSYKNYRLNNFFGFIKITLIKKPWNHFHFDLKHGILFSEEIKMLIKLGYKFKFHYFLRFVPSKLFNSYVNHFYHLKRWTEFRFWKYFSKICLNSLYGKLATKLSRNNSLQLSIAINSYSRVEMSQYRQHYFIYSDTDSIIFEKELTKRYVQQEIGMMKLVAKINYGYFLPNYYYYSTKRQIIIKAKGMIKKVAPVLNSLEYRFKLAYFKKERWKIFFKETIFKFTYQPNNVKFYHYTSKKIGVDWIVYLF